METLQAIYIALAVFGVGVTIVDLFGALDHGSDTGHGGSHDGGGHDAVAHGAGGHEAGHPLGQGSLLGSNRAEGQGGEPSRGLAGSSSVARFVSWLRTAVYFSLGAGPTGIAALSMKRGAIASLLWSLGAGVAIAILARSLRKFVRRDLDSSFTAEDFILEEADITIPVAPSLMGKAVIRKFGSQAEVYVRATSPDRAFARGDKVRIIDYQEDCYLVEAADEEHLVH